VSDHWWTVAEQADPTQLKAAVAAIVDIYRRHPAAFTALSETATYDLLVEHPLPDPGGLLIHCRTGK
jgi:TetR/AcrR family transcriptional regulator, ethionamide resistance regulator